MPFSLTYLGSELRRRWLRTLVTALGLAAGVSLVSGIIGVSAGLDAAQTDALSPLRSVGTDIMVTRVVGVQEGAQQSSFFGRGSSLNRQDAQALLNDNASILTDLSQLGDPGTHFTRDFFLPATLLTFPDQAVTQIKGLQHVTSVAGALSLLATHQTGTVPQIVATLKTQAQVIKQTGTIAPMTESERTAFQQCVGAYGGFNGPGGGPSSQELSNCLPARFRQFATTITIGPQVIQQVLNPPKTDITATNYTAGGVDTTNPGTGMVTAAQVTAGRFFTAGAQNEALLNVAYANTAHLAVGKTLSINGTTFTVVGLVAPTLAGNTADIYLPLAQLQQLATKSARVNMVLVKVDDSANVDAVTAAIKKEIPGAQVVTTKTLADQVTGSLSDAKGLVDRLGGALTIIVLGAAFLIAILLTLSGVAKRVREIGTLRAIGWRRVAVVRQIVMEAAVIGLLGGLLGIAGGIGVDAAVAHYSPALTVGNVATLGQGSSQYAGYLGNLGQEAVSQQASARATREIRIVPPLDVSVMLLGVGFALLGGLLAGGIGGWRASRLQPAAALRDLG